MGAHHFKYLITLGTDFNPELQTRGVTGFVMLGYQTAD